MTTADNSGMSEFTDKLIECADRDARDELGETIANICLEHLKTIEVLALLAILRPVKDRADVEDMFKSD